MDRPYPSQGLGPSSSPTFAGATLTGLFTQAPEDGITAHAGGGKALATALSATKNLHRVATVATAADSILLPPALAGQAHYVRNGAALAMQAFGQGSDTINGVATGTGVSQPGLSGVWYVCPTNGAWYTSPGILTDNLQALSVQVGTGSTTSAGLIIQYSGSSGNGAIYSTGVTPSTTTNAALFASSGTTVVNGTSVSALGIGGAQVLRIESGLVKLASTGTFGFASGAITAALDATATRGAANSLVFAGATGGGGAVTSRTEINKAVAAIADATPTATFTVTIPNAAHSASLRVKLTGSLGAGGAIGANEASASINYDIAICRTAGVNAVATISSAYGSAASAVAGAATVTVTAAVSAIAGAVGAANTFTVDVTITKSGGASANHTCLCYGELMNANATGVTIA